MKPKVYLETSVISYLAARPSRDLIVAANQQITQEWWQNSRPAFEVFVSALVVREAGGGDQDAARQRLVILEGVPLLTLNPDMVTLAGKLVRDVPLPSQAIADALHIAVAAVGGMDYLLTWNCKHLANAARRYQIERVCREQGYEPPIICTPQELLEE
jgi:predicted nucleic acid-binding protein